MTETNGNGNQSTDASAGELIRQLTDDASTLIRKEVELAKAEIAEKGRQARPGVGMFGAAGLLGLGAFAGLTAFLILALSEGMDGWLAALIVTVVYGAAAGVLALQGKEKVQQAGPPQPEQTTQTIKEDVQWAKNQAASVRK
jgi:putative superfamily III holin-X